MAVMPECMTIYLNTIMAKNALPILEYFDNTYVTFAGTII